MHPPRPLSACVALSLALTLTALAPAADRPGIHEGQLQIIGDDGQPAGACPLKHTAVDSYIAGFIGRTTVKQIFHNPTNQKIEAIYIFPLPQDAAVDDMLMHVGDRRIVGQIKERGEAREIYDAAKAAGHVASLLDQERPNIFTQSVANIEPGVEVTIELSFVETLEYDDGVFEWVFPMVVGPRYIPGGGSAPAPMTTGTPTDQVPDADRITPPVTPEGTRAGHDISISVTLDAGIGLTIDDVQSTLHEIDVQRSASNLCQVTLRKQNEIPNRDFVLHYTLATDSIGDTYLVHEDERGKFFTLILQPPQRVAPQQIMPRELIFVLDTSGSMSGFPIEKAKETMMKLVGTMRHEDTFNVITFAGDTHILWDAPKPATDANIKAAQGFLSTRSGGGGTEMMKAINAALVQTRPADLGPGDASHIRVVCFMTDGYVGNDMEIIDAVQKNADTTRVFSFGIGNSVNRFLLDKMAAAGRGEVEHVTLASEADEAVVRFHERILAPVLTDIDIDWGTLPVADVYPRRIPDLFSAQPIMIHGRLTGPAAGTITFRGNTGAGAYEEAIEVSWPAQPPDRAAIPSLWARAKVEYLMMQDYGAAQSGEFPDDLKQQVINLGLEYRLMTQFTSFVAVEEMTVTVGGEPRTITVPVEMPDGVSYEGIFGETTLYAMSPSTGGKASAGMARGATVTSGGGMFGQGAAPSSPPARSAPAERLVRVPEEDAEALVDYLHKQEHKLADALRDLAAKAATWQDGGTREVNGLKIVSYRLDVMIYLSDLSADTLAKLKELGFEQSAESKAVKLLIGTIDVRKLDKLAELEAVIRIRPVGV